MIFKIGHKYINLSRLTTGSEHTDDDGVRHCSVTLENGETFSFQGTDAEALQAALDLTHLINVEKLKKVSGR